MKQIFVLLICCLFAMPSSATTVSTPTSTRAAPAAVTDNFGADLLQSATEHLDHASAKLLHSLGELSQLPQAAEWVRHLLDNPWARGRAAEVLEKLAGLIVLAGAVGGLARYGTRRLLHRLALRAPEGVHGTHDPMADADAGATEALPRHGRLWLLLRRLPFVLARLLLDLLPVGVFFMAGYLLLGTALGRPKAVELMGLATVSVIAAARMVWCLMSMLVSPDEPRLRLVNTSDQAARALVNWTSWISLVAVAGMAYPSAADMLGMPYQDQSALQKLVALILHLLLIAAVLRARGAVGRWLRAPAGSHGSVAALRDWLASIWAFVAIGWIIALWFVWSVELEEGPARLLQVGAASMAVLIGGRLIYILGLGSLERLIRVPPEFAYRMPGIESRIQRYSALVRLVFRIALVWAGALLLFQLWGWHVGQWLGVDLWGGRVMSAGITILVALLLGVGIWEAANLSLVRHMEYLTSIEANRRLIRLRTIQPILRTCLMVVLGLVIAFVVLSEMGVNVAPLLAGAGIVGLAIGFGAQKLVQDVITGLFLLLDNAVQVGDGITAAGLTGKVEHLSLRCLQLRAADGILHFIPFSAVSTVSNDNRGGQAAAVLRFEFNAGTDIARACDLLARVGQQMHDDPAFTPLLRGDLAIQGIEDMTGNKTAISAQFPCLTSARGTVIYEFRRLMAAALIDAGIELAGQPPAVQLITSLPGHEERSDHAEA